MLEPNEQVVGKEDELKIREVGRPIFAWDFADGASFLEFSDHQLCGGPAVVEFPNVDRQEIEVGDNDLIGVSLCLEQSPLPGWFFRDRTTNDHESSGFFPSGWAEHKRGGLQPRTIPTIPKPADPILDRREHFGDDGIGNAFSLEKIENFLIEKGRVGPNRYFPDVFWKLRKRSFQKRNGQRSRMSVSRQPLGLPRNAALTLETEQRREGRTASFLGVVSDFGFLLMAVHRQHACIEVENHRRQIHQTLSDPVVKAEQLRNSIRSQSGQKSAKTRGVGIGSKARKIPEDTILPKQVCRLDPANPQQNRIQQRQSYISESVPSVSFSKPQFVGQAASKFQLLKKPLKQQQTAKVRQALSSKTYADFPS